MKGCCFPKYIILQAVYYKLRLSLSYRDIEELLRIRGVKVDHATIHRWVIKFSPLVRERFNSRKKNVHTSWRMDETYIQVKGQWKYLYRAVDKYGDTVDFLLTNRRLRFSAHKFLNRAISGNNTPKVINIDKSGANKSAIRVYNRRNYTKIKIRQCKYLNNIVEQDHRHIKRITNPMLGFKNFDCAQATIAGIETIRMIRKNQLVNPKSSTFNSFCSLFN